LQRNKTRKLKSGRILGEKKLLISQRFVPFFDDASALHLIEIDHQTGAHGDRAQLAAMTAG
jgi:hypothetical protein